MAINSECVGKSLKNGDAHEYFLLDFIQVCILALHDLLFALLFG